MYAFARLSSTIELGAMFASGLVVYQMLGMIELMETVGG
jgi:hypothetical protein